MITFTEHLLKLALDKKLRHFFRSGGSSGTIAKAMLHKDFSDSYMELKKMVVM
jgi:hypothetical protein